MKLYDSNHKLIEDQLIHIDSISEEEMIKDIFKYIKQNLMNFEFNKKFFMILNNGNESLSIEVRY